MSDQRTFTALRGEADFLPTTAKEFGGIDHCTRFSSNKPIDLLSVGFYGRKLTGAEYAFKHLPQPRISGKEVKRNEPTVTPKWAMLILQIRESSYFNPQIKTLKLRTFLERMAVEVDLTMHTQNDIFFVQLPEIIAIPANIVFDIAFQLYGIDELLKFHCIGESENFPKMITPQNCDVVIRVHHSSSQCAGFQFKLPESNSSGHPQRLTDDFQAQALCGNEAKEEAPKNGKTKGKKKSAVRLLSKFLVFFDDLPV